MSELNYTEQGMIFGEVYGLFKNTEIEEEKWGPQIVEFRSNIQKIAPVDQQTDYSDNPISLRFHINYIPHPECNGCDTIIVYGVQYNNKELSLDEAPKFFKRQERITKNILSIVSGECVDELDNIGAEPDYDFYFNYNLLGMPMPEEVPLESLFEKKEKAEPFLRYQELTDFVEKLFGSGGRGYWGAKGNHEITESLKAVHGTPQGYSMRFDIWKSMHFGDETPHTFCRETARETRYGSMLKKTCLTDTNKSNVSYVGDEMLNYLILKIRDFDIYFML